MKKVLKMAGIIVGVLALILIGGVAYLSIKEYKPEAIEDLAIAEGQGNIPSNAELTLMSYNIGYGCLSATEDFFMDGGKTVRPAHQSLVETNMAGIAATLTENPADIYLLQEVDINSKRSYRINEREYLADALAKNSMFAYNFNSAYVPYPWPTIGHVESGLTTYTNYNVSEAKRISLPIPFSWPVRTCNLKRCLMEMRYPIGDTAKELVVINLHMEAYDDGEGKKEQTKVLMGLLEEEYAKGNYVIAGGDFNQTFETVADSYPLINTEHFVPGAIGAADLPDGFSLVVDDTYATSRLLNEPYSGSYEDTQLYVIDGFIVSENIEVKKVAVVNTGFQYADHEPVMLEVRLK